ncbi:MAG: tRNA pseudouridine(38-40) synthase TruA [Fusobacterium sp.]|nr:tRNA pseudouridine(38-40) synthase TruA [Fusobacterium sp.]
MPTTKRYAFQIQYIGKNYAGSQIQFENGEEIDEATIQGELEKALGTLIIGGDPAKREKRPIKTVFSGRTDRGVNSKGQVVHFDTDRTIVASKFVYAMNEILPNDISISDLMEVENNFNAQKSAKKRFYRFEFINRRYKNAFDGDLMLVKYPLDLVRMQQALDYLKGEHDFSAFKSSGTLNPSKICFIYDAHVEKQGDKVIVDIVGNRFLYNMVRTIIGTLLQIEGHNLSAEHMKDVLDSQDRTKAGRTVSPYGLTLMKVQY